MPDKKCFLALNGDSGRGEEGKEEREGGREREREGIGREIGNRNELMLTLEGVTGACSRALW